LRATGPSLKLEELPLRTVGAPKEFFQEYSPKVPKGSLMEREIHPWGQSKAPL